MRSFCGWMLILIVFLSGLGAAPAPVRAQALDPQQIDAFISNLMSQYDIPGAGLALVQNGQVLYTQGYGVRSTGSGEPVTSDTLFALGSVTKSFTALGVAQLVDQGLVNLDLPVTTYIPNFTLSDPAATLSLTVRELLDQTSGLPGTNDDVWYSGQVSTLQQAVDYAATVPLAAAPGSAHIYDNFNYAIAGYLIEQVSGQTWDEYTRQHILDPLAMTTADFDIQSVQQTSDFASPHRLDILNGMQPIPFVSLAGIASAGAINASAREMANYLLLQLGDGTFNGAPIVSAALLNEMHTQQIAYPPLPPVGPTGFQFKGYGLGWITADFNGYSVLWHNGSIDGFYAMVMFIPSAQAGVVVLSNAGLGTGSLFTLAASLGLLEQMVGMPINRDVVSALNQEASFDPFDRLAKLDAARTYQADPTEWQPLIGTYNGGFGQMTVEEQDGRLVLTLGQGSRVELFPYTTDGFLVANVPTEGLISTFTFAPAQNGTMTLYQDGVEIGQKAP